MSSFPRSLLTTIALSVTLASCGLSPGGGAADASPGGVQALYAEGLSFAQFLSEADRRVETWRGNWARAAVPSGLLQRGQSIPGSWRLLVVAEDWCGDSANTLPYVARLGEALDNLEVRVVDSSRGRWVMEAHPTPDGRAATPTMVLLSSEGEEAGCLVEQPRPLQEWWLGEAVEAYPDMDERLARKYAWYDEDAGMSTMTQVLEMMEGAAADQPGCRGSSPGP